jgi:hypothetical protein
MLLSNIAKARRDLHRFAQPAIAGVSRFRLVGEDISPPSSGLWRCGKRCLFSWSPYRMRI